MFINMDYYRVFYYAAKYRSITQAAELMHSSQPNVTRTIKKLESELGCGLFVRSSRGVELTPEGKKLYAHVSVACEQIRQAEEELAKDSSLERGVVALGVSEIALHTVLLQALRAFRQEYPGVHVRLTNCSTPQALEALRGGTVDMAIATTPMEVQKPLECRTLQTFREMLIAGPAYSSLAGQRLTPALCARYPFVGLGQDMGTSGLYQRFFMEQGVQFRPDTEASGAAQLLPMVKNDLGLGFIPPSFAAEALARGEVVELELSPAPPVRRVCLVTHSARPLSVAARKLEEVLLRQGTNTEA